ncbi:MAG: dephospho-CoA kinase [Gemmatimonadota bacterium]
MSGATHAARVYRVGLTGNIAAGKSEVAAVWKRLGAPIIDADVLARRAVEPGSAGLAAVVDAFGPGVLSADGSLDRAALADVVFSDPDQRRRLEGILHPEVARLRPLAEREAVTEALESGSEARREVEAPVVVVHDIPLLFEVGLQGEFDEVVHVHAPVQTRLARLVAHRGMDPDNAAARIDAQMPSEEKIDLADRVIDNEAGLDDLAAEATRVWRLIGEASLKASRDRG